MGNNPSKTLKIHQKPSKIIRIHQKSIRNIKKNVKIHQKQSKTHQKPSKSIRNPGFVRWFLASPPWATWDGAYAPSARSCPWPAQGPSGWPLERSPGDGSHLHDEKMMRKNGGKYDPYNDDHVWIIMIHIWISAISYNDDMDIRKWWENNEKMMDLMRTYGMVWENDGTWWIHHIIFSPSSYPYPLWENDGYGYLFSVCFLFDDFWEHMIWISFRRCFLFDWWFLNGFLTTILDVVSLGLWVSVVGIWNGDEWRWMNFGFHCHWRLMGFVGFYLFFK